MLVDVPLDNAVDLHRPEPDFYRDFDGLEDSGNRKTHIVHSLECAVVHRIKTHRYPVEPGLCQACRLSRQ